MKSIYILVRQVECSECEGETDILFASEDKSILETYHKTYHAEDVDNGYYKYEILEIKILTHDFEKMLQLFSI